MCGIAVYLGRSKTIGWSFGQRSISQLQHRGPDDNGIFQDEYATLIHTRLSILELTTLGKQPMRSSCGRYTMVYNGELYNHLELRRKYLRGHPFRGHSDTETLLELFRLKQEKILPELEGMWAIAIWDHQTERLFISRCRFGQKPLYIRNLNNEWFLASEMQVLLQPGEQAAADATSIVEFLSIGHYGHLGTQTFFRQIQHFPPASYAWLQPGDTELKAQKYWQLPDIPEQDKVPFDQRTSKGLHDCVVQAVLSETMADVPIGITLSGGIDSSIIAGILATYYHQPLHIFTAQSHESKYDETRYADAVINKYSKAKFVIHRNNLDHLVLQDHIERYTQVQEEPFGDPSIIAHGQLMQMAQAAGIKVILNGQGADELFFGYNSMARNILSVQLKTGRWARYADNALALKMGPGYIGRTLLEAFMPDLEFRLRYRSRNARRTLIHPSLLAQVREELITPYRYDKINNKLKESVYGIHIPHLVHYDDRNAMAYGIEGRMPYLNYKIAEYVAGIQTGYFLKHGYRKYLLRESCKTYLPDIVYRRTDKIAFYTPLIKMLTSEKKWVREQLEGVQLLREGLMEGMLQKLYNNGIEMNDAILLWRCMSVASWQRLFHSSQIG